MDRLQERGAGTLIMVLDACRDNPFARPGQRSLGGATRGLARLDPAEGVFVLMSAGAKQAALDTLGDNDPDPNSIFTRTFLKTLATPGLTLVQIAKQTQSEVKALAGTIGHEQTPAYYDQIVGEFFLAGPGAAVPPAGLPPAKVASAPPGGNPCRHRAGAAGDRPPAAADQPDRSGARRRAAAAIASARFCPRGSAIPMDRSSFSTAPGIPPGCPKTCRAASDSG